MPVLCDPFLASISIRLRLKRHSIVLINNISYFKLFVESQGPQFFPRSVHGHFPHRPSSVQAMADFDDEGLGAPPSPAPMDRPRPANSGKKGTDKPELCPITECHEFTKAKGRFCPRHERYAAIMKYQASQAGDEQLKAFMARMKNLAVACEEIAKFSVDNAVFEDKPGKRAKVVNWAEFNARHGITLSESEGSRMTPCEKEQWILRAINKFGRTRVEAAAQWAMYERTPGKQDYEGFQNQLRLWLPKEQYIDTSRTKFITGESVEGSDRKKNPNAQYVDNLRLHVHDKFAVPHGVSHGHAFFAGRAFGGSSGAAVDLDEQLEGSADGGQDVDATRERSTKRRREHDEVRVINLEDSEEEDAAKKSKKGKKRKVNVLEDRTKAYSWGEDAVKSKREYFMKALVESQALVSALTALTMNGRADEVTRDLKVKSMNHLTSVINAWMHEGTDQWSMSDAPTQLVKGTANVPPTQLDEGTAQSTGGNEHSHGSKAEGSGGDEAGLAASTTASASGGGDQAGLAASTTASASGDQQPHVQQDTLNRRLQEADKFHGITHPHHCRSWLHVNTFLEELLSVEEAQDLEKKKLILRRMMTAVDQLATSVKAGMGAMTQYKKKKDGESERELTRSKAQREKETAAAEKDSLGQRARNLAAKKKEQNVPNFYKALASTMAGDAASGLPFLEMPVQECDGSIPGDFDVDMPHILKLSGCAVEQLLTVKTMQQVLTSWGTRYKKLANFDKDEKVSQTLVVKQGKEAVEEFFGRLTKHLRNILDFKSITESWNSTSWIWGYSDTFYSAACSPNSGAIFRLVVLGEMHVLAAPMHKLIAAFTAMGEAPANMDALSKKVQGLSEDRRKILAEKGCSFHYQLMKKETLYYIPVGWLVLEQVSASSCPLLYGIRKSYFLKSEKGISNYKASKVMLAASGLNVHKMDQVIELWEK